MILLRQNLVVELLELFKRQIARVKKVLHCPELHKILLATLARNSFYVIDLDRLLLHNVFKISDLTAKVLVLLNLTA